MPASLAAVSEVYDDETRSQAIAIWASLAAAGGALGPFLGGVLVTARDWPAVFAGNAFLAGIGLVGTVVWVAELPGRRFDRFDRLGAVLSVTAVACLVFLVIEGPRHPLAGTTLLALIGTVGLTVVFLRHEARTDDPLLPLHLFRDRDRIAGSGTLLLAALGFNGIFFVGALQLQLGWGESGLVTGLLLAPIGVVEVIVANRAVAIARRWGVQNTVTMGLCLMAGASGRSVVVRRGGCRRRPRQWSDDPAVRRSDHGFGRTRVRRLRRRRQRHGNRTGRLGWNRALGHRAGGLVRGPSPVGFDIPARRHRRRARSCRLPERLGGSVRGRGRRCGARHPGRPAEAHARRGRVQVLADLEGGELLGQVVLREDRFVAGRITRRDTGRERRDDGLGVGLVEEDEADQFLVGCIGRRR